MKYLVLLSLVACATQKPVNFDRSISGLAEWENYFDDITASSGVDSAHSGTIVIGDYNNDGKVDLLIQGKLYENTSSAHHVSFIDVTDKMGLSLKGNPMFMDVNNDSLLDIVTNRGQVWIRDRNKFKESSQIMSFKMPEDAFSLAFGDLNNDGYADLIVGRAEIHKDNKFSFVPPKIYYNNKGKFFQDVSHIYGVNSTPAYVRGIHIADYDNDSKAEIYFSNYRLKQNFLLKGNRDIAPAKGAQGEFDSDRFYDAHMKKKYGPSYGHTIGSNWVDLDNDGNLDLFVSNLVHKYVGPSKGSYDYRGYLCDDSKVYRNTGAPHYKFEDMRKNSGLPSMPIGGHGIYKGDELWAHSTAADFDNDGYQDLYVTQVYNLPYAKAKLFKNLGNFKFKDVSGRTPGYHDSYAGAWADLNNDGKMDLIISGRPGVGVSHELKILLNVQETNNNYLRVQLVGKKSGTIPVATQVRVFHSKGVFMRQVDGVTGSMNQQNDPILHFGLGKVSKISKIEVRWSSGKKQTITAAKINSKVKITEP